MAATVTSSSADLKLLLDVTPECSINAYLQRIEEGDYTPASILLLPLHGINEPQEVHASYHDRLLRCHKKPNTTITKTWEKIILAMDTNGTGVALTFDYAATLTTALLTCETSFELGRPVLLLPSRCTIIIPFTYISCTVHSFQKRPLLPLRLLPFCYLHCLLCVSTAIC